MTPLRLFWAGILWIMKLKISKDESYPGSLTSFWPAWQSQDQNVPDVFIAGCEVILQQVLLLFEETKLLCKSWANSLFGLPQRLAAPSCSKGPAALGLMLFELQPCLPVLKSGHLQKSEAFNKTLDLELERPKVTQLKYFPSASSTVIVGTTDGAGNLLWVWK